MRSLDRADSGVACWQSPHPEPAGERRLRALTSAIGTKWTSRQHAAMSGFWVKRTFVQLTRMSASLGGVLAIHSAVQLETHFRHVHTSSNDQVICSVH